MQTATSLTRAGSRENLVAAVHQHNAASRAGLSERLFTWAFSGLVYPQIWEDPEIDIEALALQDGSRVVAIASGGCNVLAYLSAAPIVVDAVDLNAHHIALNRLKLAAIRHLPGHGDVFRFFGQAGNRTNIEAYARFIRPHLDPQTAAYWDGRDWTGRSRISVFTRDFYRTGLLGRFISAAHGLARLLGVDPRDIMKSASLGDQRRFFAENLAPLTRHWLVRAITNRKASLFGLGIPPAQYDALATEGDTMADVLRNRLEKLACDFPLTGNYFAWQAFARRYPNPGEAALPRYLDPAWLPAIRRNAKAVRYHHVNLVALLSAKPAASVDRFVLLDAQDWMSDAQLAELWTEIGRTAAQGARVIFRTAARETLLPGRVPDHLLGAWTYHEAESAAWTAGDRSAIYGGFHLYVKAA